MTDQEYTMLELIVSTARRAKFNIELAEQAEDDVEKNRLLGNAKIMMIEIETAIEEDDLDHVFDNRDW